MIPYLVAYVAAGIFLVAVLIRIRMWKKMPIHVRWELYPVAHEGKRASYGGSYLEDVDWWKKPRESSLIGEASAMFQEIVFLVALKEHNPKMWRVSFPFHFGLYMLIVSVPLMILAGFVDAPALGYLVMAVGYGGLGLGLLGALGLLVRRLTAPDLRDFTAPADIFNLVLFLGVFGFTLVHVLATGGSFAGASSFLRNLVTGQMDGIPALGIVNVCLLGALIAYIPMTHMSHFVGKYFAYHAIRWNDDPNTPGSKHEKPIGDVLQYPVSWAAPHIGGDGKKTWADVATADGLAEEQKK